MGGTTGREKSAADRITRVAATGDAVQSPRLRRRVLAMLRNAFRVLGFKRRTIGRTRRRRGDRRSARVFWVWQGLRLASEGFEPRWCGVRTPLRDVFLLAISVSSPKSCPRRVRVFDLVFIFKYTRCRRRYPIIRLCYSGWYSWEIFHPEYFKPY